MKYSKIFVSLYLAGTFFASCEQQEQSYTITGAIETPKGAGTTIGYELDSVRITDVKNKRIISAPIVDNKFSLTGHVPEPIKINIEVGPMRTSFVLENANYDISYESGLVVETDAQIYNLVNGYLNDKGFQEARRKLDEFREANPMPNARSTHEDTVALRNELLKKMGELRAVSNQIEADYQKTILEGDYPVLTKLYTLQPATYGIQNFSKYKEVVARLKEELGQPGHPYVEALEASIARRQTNIDRAAEYAKGKQFTDVTTTTIDGKKITLKEVVEQNKYTLIEYWASWCGPCRAAFPHLKENYSEYKNKGFEIFGVSLDRKEKSYLKASEVEQIPWINTVDYDAFKSDAAKAYNVSGIPFTVLIDQNGTIIDAGNDLRGERLDKKLAEVFGE